MLNGISDKPTRLRTCQMLCVVLMLALTPGTVSAQGCPQGSVPPPSGLVGWWPLNETSGTTVADLSGLGNNGTASGTIGANGNPRSVPGFVGNGLNFFFGTRVNIPNSPSLSFGPPAVPQNTSFTVDAWIKGRPSPIVSNFSLANELGYTVTFDGNNVLRLEMGTGSSTNVKTWLGPAITPDAWTFIAVVVDRGTQKVTLYTAPVGGPLAFASPLPLIPVSANAYSGPLAIGGCPGNPNGCVLVLDEVEVFNRPLTQSELQSILSAGSTGKCIPPHQGMTWTHTASNVPTGTITVGCGGCDPYNGDTLCTTPLPLLCIYKPQPPQVPFPLPVGLSNGLYNQWSGGIVEATQPVPGNQFQHISANPTNQNPPPDANSYCAAQFGIGWRVAEFHDGWGWNFQAYGGVPSTRFWVHINDQASANCWQTP